MKIAITSQGATLDSPVDPRLGRARGFIITDEAGAEVRFVDNKQNLNAASGAGIQAAQTLVNEDAEVVITGNCGPKAFRVLAAGNVRVCVGASGTAREALDAFNAGDLDAADSANVEGHW